MNSDYEPASFPISLNVPADDGKNLIEARRAIALEFSRAYRWKRLSTTRVEIGSKVESGNIYRLTIPEQIEFDWTWEGAVAFGPVNPSEFIRAIESQREDDYIESKKENFGFWSGEVVEVDETNNLLFVLIEDKCVPFKGEFFVRPFEYLRNLNLILNEKDTRDAYLPHLEGRLNATCGGVHPRIGNPDHWHCLPELRQLWGFGWSILWGPPGTGKTTTIGKQVAACLENPDERILVLSTTNEATDQAIINVGKQLENTKFGRTVLENRLVRRIGRSAKINKFEESGFVSLLKGTETELLKEIRNLEGELAFVSKSDERAAVTAELKRLRASVKSTGGKLFFDPNIRVIACTNFRAMIALNTEEFRRLLVRGTAPFTTVILDEAGLVSRVGTAVTSLLASHRFVVAGDPKQLAPISRLTRAVSSNLRKWVAASALSHLKSADLEIAALHLLDTQHRMHETIGSFVSYYQYDNQLKNAPISDPEKFEIPKLLQNQPRAIWCVIDDCDLKLPEIRPERPPSGKSWIRSGTLKILEQLFEGKDFLKAEGLFISPFKAQAKAVKDFLVKNKAKHWTASTVHAQQGTQAPIVIFDVVQSGAAWAPEEWRRLVNVAISRSQSFVIVMASRQEMESTFLIEVAEKFAHRKLVKGKFATCSVSLNPAEARPNLPPVETIGGQIAESKRLRPILTRLQEELCQREINDGGPRLVRGVAGSGKTLVMANWAIRLAMQFEKRSESRIWLAYGNTMLRSGLETHLNQVATLLHQKSFALLNKFRWEDSIQLFHINDLLFGNVLEGVNLKRPVGQASLDEYETAARDALTQLGNRVCAPLCDALFIDEAQDFGAAPLELICRYVRQNDLGKPSSKAVYVFYDNAQNLYGRERPIWKKMGLNMQGRTVVMEESFRSTQPVTELAFNILHGLHPPVKDDPTGEWDDFHELLKRGLISQTTRGVLPWWETDFCKVNGMAPYLGLFASEKEQFLEISTQLKRLIQQEHVQPTDIRILMVGEQLREKLVLHLQNELKGIVKGVEIQVRNQFRLDPGVLVVTTPHAMKGHEAEIVVIPAVETYSRAGREKKWASALYVAMTRARTLLMVYGNNAGSSYHFCERLEDYFKAARQNFGVSSESRAGRVHHLSAALNLHERQWLNQLADKYDLQFTPLRDQDGKIVAEPDFWFKVGNQGYCYFGESTSNTKRNSLQSLGDWHRILPGDQISTET